MMGEMKGIVSVEFQGWRNVSSIGCLGAFACRMNVVRREVGCFACDSWGCFASCDSSGDGGVRGESCHDCRRFDEATMMGEMKAVVSGEFQG